MYNLYPDSVNIASSYKMVCPESAQEKQHQSVNNNKCQAKARLLFASKVSNSCYTDKLSSKPSLLYILAYKLTRV